MNDTKSSKELDYRWAGVTAVCGIAGVIAYIGTIAANHSTSTIITVPLVFAFAFGITVSSIGLYHVLGGTTGSRMALIAAVANVIGAAQVLAMLMVQMSVRAMVEQLETALKAVWWGLDVAWDLYLGLGTILFGLVMFGRRGLGTWLGLLGVLIGVLLLVLNIATFPKPPDTAGLVDVGPLVGLWYLVVFIRLGASSVLLKRHQRRSTTSFVGNPDPN